MLFRNTGLPGGFIFSVPKKNPYQFSSVLLGVQYLHICVQYNCLLDVF